MWVAVTGALPWETACMSPPALSPAFLHLQTGTLALKALCPCSPFPRLKGTVVRAARPRLGRGTKTALSASEPLNALDWGGGIPAAQAMPLFLLPPLGRKAPHLTHTLDWGACCQGQGRAADSPVGQAHALKEPCEGWVDAWQAGRLRLGPVVAPTGHQIAVRGGDHEVSAVDDLSTSWEAGGGPGTAGNRAVRIRI